MVKRQKPRVRKKQLRQKNNESRDRNINQLNILSGNVNSAMNKAYNQIHNIARIANEAANNPNLAEYDLDKIRMSVAILLEKADKIKEEIGREVDECRTAFRTQPSDNISLEVINFTSKVEDWVDTSYTGLIEDIEATLTYINNIIGDSSE